MNDEFEEGNDKRLNSVRRFNSILSVFWHLTEFFLRVSPFVPLYRIRTPWCHAYIRLHAFPSKRGLRNRCHNARKNTSPRCIRVGGRFAAVAGNLIHRIPAVEEHELASRRHL